METNTMMHKSISSIIRTIFFEIMDNFIFNLIFSILLFIVFYYIYYIIVGITSGIYTYYFSNQIIRAFLISIVLGPLMEETLKCISVKLDLHATIIIFIIYEFLMYSYIYYRSGLLYYIISRSPAVVLHTTTYLLMKKHNDENNLLLGYKFGIIIHFLFNFAIFAIKFR